MKRFKLLVLTFLLILSTLSPMTVHAEGNGNIDNGGGGLGEGTDTNFWNTGDEGVRVTVVSASDGSAVSASIDLTNKQPNDIRVQFGKVCKSQYRSGTVLTPDTGSYSYINPTQSLPKIITTSSGSASLAAIKSYFTDEQVIRSIAGYVGMDYDTLIGGNYKLLLEPIAYVTFEGVRTAFTATEAAMYNQVRGGMLRKKLTSLTHKNLPLAMFLETADLGYPAWGGGKNQKVSDDEIIGSLGLGIVRFNEVVTPEVIVADYEYRVDTDVVTAVTISGGQSNPDHPVSVTFSILGRNYTVNNVYYPEDGQQIRRRQVRHGVYGGLGGKKNGYGIVIGNGKQVPIRKSVRKTVKAVMDIGKMRESTWTKAGGSLAWTDIRHPYQQQWILLRMPNPLLQQLPLSRVAMV